MYILLLFVAGAANIACFIIGAKVGQKVVKGEPIETPGPSKAKQERQAKKEAEFVQDKINTIMENIERYDGTPFGQKDVPRG